MKKYFADTNIFLRFILKDNKELALKSRRYFTQAKTKQIEITILSEIILEIEYVLRKVYLISRNEISSHLSSLINTSYFRVVDRSLYSMAIDIYNKSAFDLVDIFLYLKAKEKNAEVMSFDRDFVTLKRKLNRIINNEKD